MTDHTRDLKTAEIAVSSKWTTAKLWRTETGRWAVTGHYISGFEVFPADDRDSAILKLAEQIRFEMACHENQ